MHHKRREHSKGGEIGEGPAEERDTETDEIDRRGHLYAHMRAFACFPVITVYKHRSRIRELT